MPVEEPTTADLLEEVRIKRLHPIFFLLDAEDAIKAARGVDVPEHLQPTVEKLVVALQDCLDHLRTAEEEEGRLTRQVRNLELKISGLEETHERADTSFKRSTSANNVLKFRLKKLTSEMMSELTKGE
jgi:hypothetical protein